jgi:hypothetical protein
MGNSALELKWCKRLLCIILINYKGIALGYGLEDRGVRVPARAGNFSLHHRVQTGSEIHPASCPMGTRGSFSRGEGARP